MAAIDGKLYLVGGFDALPPHDAVAVVDVYEPATGEWSTVAPLPSPRGAGAVVAVDGMLYVLGGVFDGATLEDVLRVQRYDPVTDEWTTVAPASFPMIEMKAAAYDGSIYAIDPDVGRLQVYDVGTDSWDQKAELPAPRNFYTAASLDGEVYWVAGTCVGGCGEGLVDIYDPSTNTWRVGTPYPVSGSYNGLFAPASGVVDGRLYVVGGFSEPGMGDGLLIYDPDEDLWSQGPPMANSRQLHEAAVINGKLYVGGGMNSDFEPVLELEVFVPGDKVCICHYPPGNPNKAKTICVGADAAEAHLSQHRDTLGQCAF